MRSIKASFMRISKDNPDWGNYVCLAKAVSGRNFTQRFITDNFRKLIKKDDYFGSKNYLIKHLVELSQKVS